jgi:hypothetical protein
MKRTLGPNWSTEQIAAGERFKQGWLDFFGRLGAAAPEVPPDLGLEAGSGAAIRAKHEARLLAYPNVVGLTEETPGARDERRGGAADGPPLQP